MTQNENIMKSLHALAKQEQVLQAVARAKREAKFGRLPLWWYPCAVIAFAIPFMTLALIIFT